MLEYLNPTGIDTYQNTLQLDGQIIHAVNVYNPGQGILAKRPGFNTFLNNPDSMQVQQVFNFPEQDGTTLYMYRASGSLLYYSQQGTGNWTIAGNGTIANNAHVGHAILNNTLIIGDGIGSTRHTSNGTSFTNTTLAPISQYLAQYHQRIYASSGTDSTLTYSSYGSADNWSLALPADSSSFTVPDEGANANLFVAGDRLIVTKNKGKMFNWDDYSLVDMTTRYGPTIPWSLGNSDDTWFYGNQLGVFQYEGANRTLISNPVQNQFYNSQGLGAADQQYIKNGYGYGVAHNWDYLLTLGTLTDSFVGRQISNVIVKYDFLKNQFHNWSFPNPPTSWCSYADANNVKQLIWGDITGQCRQLSATATSDNGAPIPTEVVFLFTYASQANMMSPTSVSTVSGSTYEKKWNWLRLFFQPGDEVNVQVAFSNTLTYQHLKWSSPRNTKERGNVGDYWQSSDGVVEMRFPMTENNPPRSRFMFLRMYDNSDSSAWIYRGCAVDAEVQLIK